MITWTMIIVNCLILLYLLPKVSRLLKYFIKYRNPTNQELKNLHLNKFVFSSKHSDMQSVYEELTSNNFNINKFNWSIIAPYNCEMILSPSYNFANLKKNLVYELSAIIEGKFLYKFQSSPEESYGILVHRTNLIQVIEQLIDLQTNQQISELELVEAFKQSLTKNLHIGKTDQIMLTVKDQKPTEKNIRGTFMKEWAFTGDVSGMGTIIFIIMIMNAVFYGIKLFTIESPNLASHAVWQMTAALLVLVSLFPLFFSVLRSNCSVFLPSLFAETR